MLVSTSVFTRALALIKTWEEILALMDARKTANFWVKKNIINEKVYILFAAFLMLYHSLCNTWSNYEINVVTLLRNSKRRVMTSRGKVENMWCLTLSPQKMNTFVIFSRATSHLAFTFLEFSVHSFYTWDSVSCIVIPTSSCVLLSALNLLLIRSNPIKNMNTYPSPSLFF